MTQLPVIVAIPARNEADRIGACLSALAAQSAAGRIAAVALFANNCTDATAAIARTMALPFPLTIIEAALPPAKAHIGHARRGATAAAAACMRALGHSDAIIAGTDADSRVLPGWLAALTAAFAADVDAVCGEIDLDGPVAPALAAARRAEAAYADTAARAAAWLDPLPHDPWPNHIWSWGANFAVRGSVLARVGGSPLVDLAEDRALHALLLRDDARIRHATAVRVQTSARADGRAPGGLADLLSDYAADPAALADFALEPAAMTWRRAQARGAARRQWGARPGFGTFWADIEAATESLARQRIAVADLDRETARLGAWITAAARRSDRLPAATATAYAPRAASRQ
jgi:cellulose synthase/poly-beta-1,6-N-acetylglucosamine synthase-like glycosyltransferase